jgi:N-methylhydantoinase A
VHAYRVAQILQVPRLLAPLGAGVTSAIGFLAAPLAFDFVRSYYGLLDALDWAHVNVLFDEMEREGRAILSQAGVRQSDVRVARTAELRYVGQGHEVPVSVPDDTLSADSAAVLFPRFEEVYRRLYERTAPGNPVEALSWRVVVSAPRPDLPLERLAAGMDAKSDAARALKGERAIYLPEERALVPVPVYDRYRLGVGATCDGPAVVEERESTLIIGPGGRATVDRLMTVVVDL